MAIHLGYLRAGWAGLIVGGTCFIMPAVAIVMLLAWAYVQYGSTPTAAWLLYGVKPVIIAVVVQALWGLLRTALKSAALAVLAVGVIALYLLGINEIALLFGGAAAYVVYEGARRAWTSRTTVGVALPLGWLVPSMLAQSIAAPASFSMGTLFLTFLKIGAVLYGSGYVLLAFLRNDFVERLGWLTERQLLDAVAVGQVTPGPLFTTATFIGYVLGGIPGGLVATLGIFLPSFVFVAISGPIIPRLRRWPWTAAMLDGVNVAALGLMAAVTWELGTDAIVDWLTATLAIAAAVLLIRFRVNSAWLVLGGALVGLLVH
jgi:chromate transporter